MRRSTLPLFLVVALFTTSIAQAQEVCSQSGVGELRSCVSEAVSSCVGATNVCTKDTTVLTIEDVRNEAIRSCCKASLNRGRRTSCFNKLKQRYKVTKTTRSLSRFVSTARSEIDKIRKSNCFNGAYNNLF